MPVVEICCLANSRKMQGRCIAGINLTSGRWYRPVSPFQFRELYEFHYGLPQPWVEPRPLDIVQVGFAGRCAKRHHPEDCLVDETNWRLVRRPTATPELHQLKAQLSRFLHSERFLFGTPGDRVPFEQFEETPANASLALVRAERFTWRITSWDDKRKNRVCFTYRGNQYDIVMTDPIWEQKLAHLQAGTHPPTATGIAANSEIWVTVSLGEPYNGDCFKLAAAVIAWPPA